MSDGNIVNDWIDADKLRRVAEDLLSPTAEVEEGQADAATFGDDFVGFAEVESPSPSPAPTPTPAAKSNEVLEAARESLSKAQGTAASAGIISPPTQDPFPPAPTAKTTSPKEVESAPVPEVKSISEVTLPPKVVPAPEVKPQAAPVAAPTPVTQPVVSQPSSPVVKPAPITQECINPTSSMGNTQRVSVKAVASPAPGAKVDIKSPFRIVTSPITAEDLAKLPRSV